MNEEIIPQAIQDGPARRRMSKQIPPMTKG